MVLAARWAPAPVGALGLEIGAADLAAATQVASWTHLLEFGYRTGAPTSGTGVIGWLG